MGKEIILTQHVSKHKYKDESWDMHEFEIEDKIKELRKQIYNLQNSRKKQPHLLVFRKETFGKGELRAHIFAGFQIMDEKDGIICADSWHPIIEEEADTVIKKYKLTKEALKIIENTIEETNKKRVAEKL